MGRPGSACQVARPRDGQATRRHPGGPAESCFLPDLTRFTGSRRAGPVHATGEPPRRRSLVVEGRQRTGTIAAPREGCESGRIGTLGKRVRGNPPWVRIPLPPPFKVPLRWVGFLGGRRHACTPEFSSNTFWRVPERHFYGHPRRRQRRVYGARSAQVCTAATYAERPWSQGVNAGYGAALAWAYGLREKIRVQPLTRREPPARRSYRAFQSEHDERLLALGSHGTLSRPGMRSSPAR